MSFAADDNWKTKQIFIHRKKLGLVSLNKQNLISIGEALSAEFSNEDVAVFIGQENQRLLYLPKFKETIDMVPHTDFAKLILSEAEGDGFVRQIVIEFGPYENFIQAQSVDESWAIGVVERFKRLTKPHELPKFLDFDGIGSSFNALILFGMIAYVPSISTFGQRLFYVVLLLAVMVLVARLHRSLVPNALISLNEDMTSRLKRSLQKFSSVVVGLAGAALAAFVTLKFGAILSWAEGIVSSVGDK